MSQMYKAFVVIHFEADDGSVDPWFDAEELVSEIANFIECDVELKDIEEEI